MTLMQRLAPIVHQPSVPNVPEASFATATLTASIVWLQTANWAVAGPARQASQSASANVTAMADRSGMSGGRLEPKGFFRALRIDIAKLDCHHRDIVDGPAIQ